MAKKLSNQDVTGTVSVSGDLSTSGKLSVNASAGDEGGEIFLNKSVTNTTISGGVTIDVYQDKLRIFEQGGSARGYYLDIPSGGAGVSVQLPVPTGAVFQWVTASSPTGYLLCDGSAVSRTTYSNLFNVLSTTYGAGDGSTTFNLPNLQSRTPVGYQAPSSIGTATITIAAPGVVTRSNHGLATGQIVYFTTTGALPTGITANTRYWVNVLTSSTFRLSTSLNNAFAGTSITTSGTQSGTHTVFSADFDLGRSNGEINHEQTLTELATHNHTQSAHSHTIPNSVTVPGSTAISGFESWSNGNDQSRVISTGSATPAIQNSGSGLSMNIMQPYLTMNFIIKT